MTPFQKIPEACKTTGLSMYFLRKGCKDGSVPHIKSGPTYYVNIPALLQKLNENKEKEAAIALQRNDGEVEQVVNDTVSASNSINE